MILFLDKNTSLVYHIHESKAHIINVSDDSGLRIYYINGVSMKRNIIGGAFTLASLMLAGHALAEDGVVHFVGEIVDSTCEVT